MADLRVEFDICAGPVEVDEEPIALLVAELSFFVIPKLIRLFKGMLASACRC